MKEIFKKAEQAYIIELLMMVLVLYIYDPINNIYWIIILLADVYMFDRMDVVAITKASLLPEYKKETIKIMILEGIFIIGLVIIVFKQPSLAVLLLVNDILVEVASVFKHINGKKTK